MQYRGPDEGYGLRQRDLDVQKHRAAARVPHPAHVVRSFTNHDFSPKLAGLAACVFGMNWCQSEPKLSPTVISMVRDHAGGNGAGRGFPGYIAAGNKRMPMVPFPPAGR
jgi:hypothetical protein